MRRLFLLLLLIANAASADVVGVGVGVEGSSNVMGKEVRVIVPPAPPPPPPPPPAAVEIRTFQSTAPDPMSSGGGAHTISWTTENATSCIRGQDVGTDFTNGTPVGTSLNGSIAVTTAVTQTYYLVCQGPSGPANGYLLVNVTPTPAPTTDPTPPVIIYFDKNTSFLPVGGGTVVLSWTAINAEGSCEGTNFSTNPPYSGTPTSGTARPTIAATTTFRITCTGSPDFGETTYREVSVTVAPYAGGGGIAGVEQACTDLGSNCICSEPLNVSQTVNSGFTDPSDSDTKECAGEGNDGAAVYAQGGGASVAAFDMPVGATASYVWRWDGTGSSINHLDGSNVTFTVGTMCVRMYQRFSADFNDPIVDGADVRAKIQEISFDLTTDGDSDADFLLQTQWHFATNPSRVKVETGTGTWGLDEDVARSGDLIELSECKDSWCRFESCVDRFAGGVVTPRTRVVRVDDGQTSTFTGTSGSQTNEAERYHYWIGNMFRQSSAASGQRYGSYGIQTFHATPNSAYWPGPACEVEGGC